MSAEVQTNAGELREQYALMGRSLDSALQRGMRRLVLAVKREQVKNLGGSGGPGDYPVPIRSGNLRLSAGSRVAGPLLGFVFNRATYARAIHEGFQPYNNQNARQIRARRFLDRAAEAVDSGEIIQRALREGLQL